ncbi:hypothetical protein ACJD0Z_10375 [Flavobacteriaceae bacterium M23B6Z8]
MKNRKRRLGKLKLRKSIVANFRTNSLKGGTGGVEGTVNCKTIECTNDSEKCPAWTDDCPSGSICPGGVQCY